MTACLTRICSTPSRQSWNRRVDDGSGRPSCMPKRRMTSPAATEHCRIAISRSRSHGKVSIPAPGLVATAEWLNERWRGSTAFADSPSATSVEKISTRHSSHSAVRSSAGIRFSTSERF
jgi:hypothetical protein